MLAGLMSRWTSPVLVGGGQRVSDLGADAEDLGDVERAVLVEPRPQGRAPDQLHHDRFEALVAERVVDRHDRRVGEAGGGDGLGPEPFDERVCRPPGADGGS